LPSPGSGPDFEEHHAGYEDDREEPDHQSDVYPAVVIRPCRCAHAQRRRGRNTRRQWTARVGRKPADGSDRRSGEIVATRLSRQINPTESAFHLRSPDAEAVGRHDHHRRVELQLRCHELRVSLRFPEQPDLLGEIVAAGDQGHPDRIPPLLDCLKVAEKS
jgi:hypothetical protein